MSRKVQLILATALAIILLLSLGVTGFLAGILAALLPVPFYVALALWLDRNEPEPRALLVKSFLWGMLVASLFSIFMNAAAVAYVQVTLGLSRIVGERVGLLLASPVFEETSKGLALFLLFQRQRDEFDDVVDGAVYAAMVGLGFAATENILYYGNAALHGRLAAVFALRGVASPFAHPLFTAMTGIGFGLARDQRTRRAAALRVAVGLCAAILLHAIWNAAVSAHLFLESYTIIMVPTFAGVLLLLHKSLERETALMRAHLLRECSAAGISEGDVHRLCAHRGVAAWLKGVRRHVTKSELKAATRARRAGIELAFACWHAQCAEKPEDARIARLRAEYVEACAQWRGQNY